MATAECQGYWPKGWPNCPEIVAVWATGGGVSGFFFDTAEAHNNERCFIKAAYIFLFGHLFI